MGTSTLLQKQCRYQTLQEEKFSTWGVSAWENKEKKNVYHSNNP